jgi:hypothetical protein
MDLPEKRKTEQKIIKTGNLRFENQLLEATYSKYKM